MSTPVNYTSNDFFSKFALARKNYFISDKKIEVPSIEYQASGIICLITSVAMICLANAFNLLIGSAFIISGSILYLVIIISSLREAVCKTSNIADPILVKKD